MNMLPMPGEPAFDPERPDRVAYSYFRREPWLENEGMGYLSERYASKTFTSFSHTMADIVGAVSAAGMRVEKLPGVRLRRRADRRLRREGAAPLLPAHRRKGPREVSFPR